MEFWRRIKNLKGNTLRTLFKGKPFDIVDISDNAIIIRPHHKNKKRVIQRKEIEGAHKELFALGHISRSEIEARHALRNPAYVAALLAEEEGVIYTNRPIVLRIHKRI